MNEVWRKRWASALSELKVTDSFRRRQSLQSAQGSRLQIDNKLYLNFSSNDYLSLANDDDIAEAFAEGVRRYGVGSGASHLVAGHSEAHARLEAQIARWTGRDRALVFSSGFAANLSVLTTLFDANDVIYGDKLNHASLVDGGLYSAAHLKRYRHLECNHLQSLLDNAGVSDRSFCGIVTDSVFSMDGDIAPLKQLSAIAHDYDAMLIVDDAHGLGVFGEQGQGCVAQAGLGQAEVPVLIGTFGKALGCAGAFVAGNHEMIEFLVQRARHYIYTTACPPALACAVSRAIQKVIESPALRSTLAQRVKQFSDGLGAIPFTARMPEQVFSSTHIQPLIVGDNQTALALSGQLKEAGILVVAIRPPTVPANKARLRISLSASHTEEDIDYLLKSLRDCCVRLGLAA